MTDTKQHIKFTTEIAGIDGEDLTVFADGQTIGRLFAVGLDRVEFAFVTMDEALEQALDFTGCKNALHQLAEIRRAYRALEADRRAESDAEMAAEGAWLRASEYDGEAYDEMVRQDAEGGSL